MKIESSMKPESSMKFGGIPEEEEEFKKNVVGECYAIFSIVMLKKNF